ncbi:ArsR family transcriptional regulator [Dethiosulfatibacter aminovorans DSM 17477]|uniref:ArsR family transcriptional regulator n=1 Tax=Dethiosulfatibacter aminovorans DSM 17477 TaxID=1121476 RepID=A0A1M6FB46_9FIRM|nr:metalloregulator ArsR/SmtB family transcription factor [Dethiosulfatibacter aminovorans]SHI94871.1 ArsR family transcriptional regulator [Dethiosulfatibacter aminovorans DSM 17477]
MDIKEFEVKFFKALAHPVRIDIIKQLSAGRLCVCEIVSEEYSQSNMSQHLKILRDAGILTVEKEGNKMMYEIKNMDIVEIIKKVDEIIIEDLKSLLGNI